MSEMRLARRLGRHDPVHRELQRRLQVPTKRYLWTPSHAITFVPRLSPTIYGDGRALFGITTINNRPAFWYFRGDSGWTLGQDANVPDSSVEISEFIDDILEDLEDAFGSMRCGYSGANLSFPPEDRDCTCEECMAPYVEIYPSVDAQDGSMWWREEWPKPFGALPHPYHWRGNRLPARLHPPGGGG